MTLIEYIEKSYLRPNVQVLRALGAEDVLIQYLLNTPWNTNMAIIKSLIGEDSGNSAVVGTAVVGTATI